MAMDLSSFRETLPPVSGGSSLEEGEGPRLEIKVMSWNINGRGPAQDRNRLVPLVVREVGPDVLLLQETETDALVTSIRSQARGAGRGYEEVSAGNTKEARVLYDLKLYEAIPEARIFPGRGDRGRISLAEVLEQSLPQEEQRELRGRAAGGMRQLFRRRIAIVGLKRREHELVPGRVMVFMSFHNVNTSKGGEVREKGARGFCEIVQTVRELTGSVVIAGADLNQQMRSDTPTIPQYRPTSRRSRIIDYFILASPPGRLEHSPVSALDIVGARDDPLNPLHRLVAELLRPPMRGPARTIEDYGRAVDHDPLVCNLIVSSLNTQGTGWTHYTV